MTVTKCELQDFAFSDGHCTMSDFLVLIQTPKQFQNFLIQVVSGASENELQFRSQTQRIAFRTFPHLPSLDQELKSKNSLGVGRDQEELCSSCPFSLEHLVKLPKQKTKKNWKPGFKNQLNTQVMYHLVSLKFEEFIPL